MTAPATAGKASPAPPRAAGPHTSAPDQVRRPGEMLEDAVQRCGSTGPVDDPGLRIGDVAARAGVSTRTLRYYEELGLLEPSGRTAGGERRYQAHDVVRLERIIEYKNLLGMNLQEIRVLLSSQARLDQLRVAYRAYKDTPAKESKEKRRAILEEALALQISLVERMDSKLASLTAFRAETHAAAERCVLLLQQLA
ncbi:MAG: helix-turn-helix domain-containing protein [Acidimicrobiales bacterium]